MTATIAPRSEIGNLAVRDPSERARQYAIALTKFKARLGDSINGIVFAENSGADLHEFAERFNLVHAAEFVAVPPQDLESSSGRGYHETLLVRDAFEKSSMLQGTGTIAMKVTGRYSIPNIKSVLAREPIGPDLTVNVRGYPRPWADMWVYQLNAVGARLLSSKVELLRGDPAELGMMRLMREAESEGARVSLRMKSDPLILGQRGSDGSAYGFLPQLGKWSVRWAGRRVVPDLRI
jgi:hypothetical protein